MGTCAKTPRTLTRRFVRPTAQFVFDHLRLVVYIRQLNDESPAPLMIGLTLLAVGCADRKQNETRF